MIRPGDDLRMGCPGEPARPRQPIGPRRRGGRVGEQLRHRVRPRPDVPERAYTAAGSPASHRAGMSLAITAAPHARASITGSPNPSASLGMKAEGATHFLALCLTDDAGGNESGSFVRSKARRGGSFAKEYKWFRHADVFKAACDVFGIS